MASQPVAEDFQAPGRQQVNSDDVATPSTAAAAAVTLDTANTKEKKEDPNKGKIRISKLGTKYLVYDVKDASLLRRMYRMGGTFSGILPQAPNQNALGGMPLQLSADNVSWLVQDLKVAYVASDWEAHRNVLYGPDSSKEKSAYKKFVNDGRRAAQARFDADQAQRMAESARLKAANADRARKVKAEREKKRAAGGKEDDDSRTRDAWVVLADPRKKEMTDASTTASTDVGSGSEFGWPTEDEQSEPETAANARSEKGKGKEVEREAKAPEQKGESKGKEDCEKDKSTAASQMSSASKKLSLLHITPTTSTGLVGNRYRTGDDENGVDADVAVPLPPRTSQADVSADALRAELANRGYYTTPGLRFGGDLSVYPGDPLRYHAHYVATSYGWDEPITMLDLVGTGRLATGVKKGLLIGGAKPAGEGEAKKEEDDKADNANTAIDDTPKTEPVVAGSSSSSGVNGTGCRSFTIEWAAI